MEGIDGADKLINGFGACGPASAEADATLPALSLVRGLVLEDEFAALDEGVVVDAARR